MTTSLQEVREGTMEAMGRITSFWGFSKVMGQIYGLLYLSAKPLSLDEISENLSISKGNVSINVRALERWNMVRHVWVRGDRKDFYEAETDFWKIVKGVLKEREKKEFDQALSSVGRFLKKAEEAGKAGKNPEIVFISDRLKNLEDFIGTMDKMVSVFLTLEDLKRNFLNVTKKK